MRGWAILALAAMLAAPLAASDKKPGTLEAAVEALNSDRIRSVEFTGTGKWYQFGQEPNPNAPPPQFDVTSYTALMDYNTATSHIQRVASQTFDPTRWRPVPLTAPGNRGGDGNQEFVAGGIAWILGATGGPATGLPVTAISDAKNAEERTMEIWATPQGFLRAAVANNATSRPINGGGSEVTFMMGKHKLIGKINARNEVYLISYWIDNPVLGDMVCQAGFTDYRDFGGIMFPGHIVRVQGGKVRLDLNVSSAKANVPVVIPVPEGMREAMTAPVKVTADKLAEGVYWFKGFQWHSVGVEQGDHIVMIDAPLDEERSLAVIAKAKEVMPNKPITYLINTHAHFDHAGGVRTYAAQGATIVAHPISQAFYERVWRNPHTLNPDQLSTSKKAPKFLTVTNGKLVLNDSKRPIEVYEQVGMGHSDCMVFAFLPVEKILVQADDWNTEALSAPRLDTIGGEYVNPYTINMYDNIMRLNLDMRLMVPLHGPRTTTMEEVRKVLMIE